MEPKTPQQQIELFHLIFLRHLGERIDKSHYALKGGCNLRFYFKSIRYSEDIDLDVKTVAKDTLKAQINKLLNSTSFQHVLQTKKLQISDVNAAKQTETTQRWKLQIRGLGTGSSVPTKIEFSRRGMREGYLYESVDADVTSAYQLYPILSNHYTLSVALIQKVAALMDRTETQARDVFDIHHLLDLKADPNSLSSEMKSRLDKAIENTISISYGHYKSQVVAYLGSDYQEYYGSEAKWNQMQERLLKVFEEVKEVN